MVARADIVAAALAYEGVRFGHLGRAGRIDCLGLLVMVARDLQIPHRDPSAYARRGNGVELRAGLNAQLWKRTDGLREPGDVLLLAYPTDPPGHVGILLPDNRMIHASASARRVAICGFVKPWPDRLRGVFMFPGVV